jgi:hypothetical protein
MSELGLWIGNGTNMTAIMDRLESLLSYIIEHMRTEIKTNKEMRAAVIAGQDGGHNKHHASVRNSTGRSKGHD